jgi:hypothetical protein
VFHHLHATVWAAEIPVDEKQAPSQKEMEEATFLLTRYGRAHGFGRRPDGLVKYPEM